MVALADASRAVKADVAIVVASLRNYEAVVEVVAAGDAAVINAAGLCSNEDGPDTAAVPRQVTGVRSKPGEHAAEAILSWRATPGAVGYAIQVNLTPETPEGPWMVLRGEGRRPWHVVRALAPGARFLARVAAFGKDGIPAGWSAPVLVVAC